MPSKPKNSCTWPFALAFMSALVAGLICTIVFVPIKKSLEDVMPDFAEYVPPANDNTKTTPDDQVKPSRYEFMQCPDGANLGECCNGLESNCDLRVNEMMFAAGHNLMSSKDNGAPASLYNHFIKIEGSNETDGKGALDFGYRNIILDLCECDGKLAFCHSVCVGERDPEEVLSHINSYLEDNQSEVVILTFQIVNQNSFGEVFNVSLDGLYSIMQGVSGFVDKMHVLDNGTEWPLMKTLVENGEQIIVFHHEGPTCRVADECPPGMHYYFDHAGESEFSIDTVGDLKDSENFCNITRGKRSNGGRENLYGVNNFLRLPDENVAATTNELQFIKNRAAGCDSVTGVLPNMVIVDFWSLGDLPQFTQEENKARAAAKQAIAQQKSNLRA